MEQNDFQRYGQGKGSRVWSGLILLAAGFLLLAYKMGAPIPGWLFTWPVLLILIGIIAGIKSKFHNPGAFILILIGAVFLSDRVIPGIDFQNYIFPILLIAVGLLFILRPKKSCDSKQRCFTRTDKNEATNFTNSNEQNLTINSEDEEYLDVNAIFGGVKKKILSKNFKGGEIVSFMGGTEINLLQADIQHPVELEINNIFGGTKIVIPANWDLKNEVTALFGGVEDKRLINNVIPERNKILLIKGACVFGGIEISNY